MAKQQQQLQQLQQWIRKTENELVIECLRWLAQQKQKQLNNNYCVVLANFFEQQDYTVQGISEKQYYTARRYVLAACHCGMKYLSLNEDEYLTLQRVVGKLWQVDHPINKTKFAACCVVQ